MSLIGVRQNARIRFTSEIGASRKTYDFELDEMRIFEQHEEYVYTLANDKTVHFMGRFFLNYRLQFRRMKRVETGASTDLIDLLNDFRNPDATINFYPIYDVDNLLYYEVRLNQPRTDLVRFDRGMQRYGTRLDIINVQGADTLDVPFRKTTSITLNNIRGVPSPDA